MTPQEKAVELFHRFYHIDSFLDEMDGGSAKSDSKECALIAVEEIENALKDCAELSDSMQNMDRALNFWQNVRKEIECL